MDIPQLKLLAGHVRSLLTNANQAVSHNQSLDIIAALPGLRNWPEVQAFPDRVTTCELDAAAAGRLAYRLKRKFEIELTSHDVLEVLRPQLQLLPKSAPQIWPTGPVPGVYVTTSQAAIDALVSKYEEATDGAVLYAERAANRAEGAIDLGDYGLWSSGLDRLPSGTLIVVGPLALVQEEWERSTERLQMACTVAELSGHRVAVLVETPTPEDLCEDIHVMAATKDSAGGNEGDEVALRGVVTEGGELVQRVPFARSWPAIEMVPSTAKPDAIPSPARQLLNQVLETRKTGLLLVGSGSIEGHWAADLVEASLALTHHAGPAVRIMPETRSSPTKGAQLPDATRQLPLLPSIQSAYERGYRRMVVDPFYVEWKVLKQYAPEVLFISGTYGYEVSNLVYSGASGLMSAAQDVEFLYLVVALLSVARLPTRSGVFAISDLFIGPARFPTEAKRISDITEYVADNRAIRWEDQAQLLISRGDITIDDLQEIDTQPRSLARFIEQIGELFTPGSKAN